MNDFYDVLSLFLVLKYSVSFIRALVSRFVFCAQEKRDNRKAACIMMMFCCRVVANTERATALS